VVPSPDRRRLSTNASKASFSLDVEASIQSVEKRGRGSTTTYYTTAYPQIPATLLFLVAEAALSLSQRRPQPLGLLSSSFFFFDFDPSFSPDVAGIFLWPHHILSFAPARLDRGGKKNVACDLGTIATKQQSADLFPSRSLLQKPAQVPRTWNL
jgi:hypothetical protein